MKATAAACLLTALSFVTPAFAGPGQLAYDGAWSLNFVTQRGACTSYNFNVNIANGTVSHPNLVRFRGRVAAGGHVRASVIVQDKFAAGSGLLSGSSGRGTWTGRDSSSRCSGYWTAQKL